MENSRPVNGGLSQASLRLKIAIPFAENAEKMRHTPLASAYK
jgi:hypothetical protein